MKPVLALVGRQNVGKSTLFNCLTRSRNALVSEIAGMTRDRQYGDAYFLDYQFIVIDTAGIGDNTEEIDKLSIEQSLQAVEEADKVLFLVDGRAGITAEDRTLASLLRTMNKTIYLVVNKTEGIHDDLASAEFFSLGFGQPLCISSAHYYGLDDLIQTVFADLPEARVEEGEKKYDDSVIKLAIIGKPNVGKSTLINRMLGEERVIVFDQPGTTRDSIFIPLERNDQKYMLIDTAGIRRRGKIFETTEKFSVVKTLQAIADTNVVLFVIDAREGATEQDMRLLGYIIESGKALVVALNKWDGMSEEEREQTRTTVDRRLNFVDFARLHYISALHGSGVGNLFTSINEAFASANKTMATSALNKILREALLKHSPPLVHGRRVKPRYAHTGGHNPPIVIIHGNQVEDLPESYTRFLEGFYQEKLGLIGTPIKIEYKNSSNPYEGKRNVLTESQLRKRKRMIKHSKR